jgi:hypothetical protein
MPTYPSSDESFGRLKRAGWSVGETAVLGAAGRRWLVSGVNGENVIQAEGDTQAEAWFRACQQAGSGGDAAASRLSGLSRSEFVRC